MLNRHLASSDEHAFSSAGFELTVNTVKIATIRALLNT
jgi:hypothetical protein